MCTSQHYFVPQTLHKVLPSTTSYYKPCAKYFPALLRTTKLAQSAFQHYFVQQKLAKSTSQYYFGLHSLLAQGASRYYFLLQSSLHKVPRTTSCHRACTKYFTSSTGDSGDAWVRFQILCPAARRAIKKIKKKVDPLNGKWVCTHSEPKLWRCLLVFPANQRVQPRYQK